MTPNNLHINSQEVSTSGITIAIVGIGLIGGSLALTLRKNHFAGKIIGVDANPNHACEAIALGIVDEIAPLTEAVNKAELIVLAVPVTTSIPLVIDILDLVDFQVVTDVGSTKAGISTAIEFHSKRGRFVAAHPMWGTEFSGPSAATTAAFAGKATVICNKENIDADALVLVENMYRSLGMHLLYMDAYHHDVHTAYISHISHISSFALANTVLEKEKEENAIFELASGGFESTVRLAKSNADTWVPIFMQNKENVLDVLNEHISQLRKFKACLEKENWEYLRELICHANEIKRILQ